MIFLTNLFFNINQRLSDFNEVNFDKGGRVTMEAYSQL